MRYWDYGFIMTSGGFGEAKSKGIFSVILKGKGVRDGMVDAKLLGEILINMQTIIYHAANKLANVKRDKHFYDLYKVGFTKIEKGSAIISLEPMSGTRTLFEEVPLEHPMKELFTLINLINENPDEGRNYLSEKIKESKDRLVLEAKLYEIWSIKGLDISLKFDGFKFSSGGYVPLRKDREEILTKWLEEDMKEASRKIEGIITRIKADGRNRYFTILSMDGEMYKYEYTPSKTDIETQVIELIKTPVEIIGITAGGVRSKVIKEILELRPLDKIKIEDLDDIKLKKPLLIDISYDSEDDLWVLENDNLRIYGVGETYEEALERLKENLEIVIEEYMYEDDSKLTETAKQLKQRLREYIEG